MISLVYVSQATEPFSDDELIRLLDIARRNNQQLQVTGILLYKHPVFIQALEGPEEHVQGLYDKIATDPRHRNANIIYRSPTLAREFPDWSMGFRSADHPDMRDRPGVNAFFNLPLNSRDFTVDAGQVRALLGDLRGTFLV
jgi:hypothetical protein